MPKNSDAVNDVFQAVGLLIFILVEVVLVYFALFNQGGAENEANLFILFVSSTIGIIGIFALLLFKIVSLLGSANPRRFGWLNVIIHDPETSDLPKGVKSSRFLKNPVLLALISIPVASVFGLIQVYQNTFWTGLPSRVPQQITETAHGILSTTPADWEIYVPVVIAGLLVSFILWRVKYKKLDVGVGQLIIYLGIPILYAVAWLGVHFFAHGSDQVALQFVLFFGLLSAYLLVVLRSVIPVLVLKIMNNLYAWLNGFIGSDERILVITVLVNLFLIGFAVAVFTINGGRRANG